MPVLSSTFHRVLPFPSRIKPCCSSSAKERESTSDVRLRGMSEFALRFFSPSPRTLFHSVSSFSCSFVFFSLSLLTRKHCSWVTVRHFSSVDGSNWTWLRQWFYTLLSPLFQVPRIRVNYSFVSTILQPRANYKHVECLKHATGRSYRVRLAMLLTHSLFLFASTRTPMRTERNPLFQPRYSPSFFIFLSNRPHY